MDSDKNYFEKMILDVVMSIKHNEYEWPGNWIEIDKLEFLDECLEWLEINELYEYCQVINDEKEKIQKK